MFFFNSNSFPFHLDDNQIHIDLFQLITEHSGLPSSPSWGWVAQDTDYTVYVHLSQLIEPYTSDLALPCTYVILQWTFLKTRACHNEKFDDVEITLELGGFNATFLLLLNLQPGHSRAGREHLCFVWHRRRLKLSQGSLSRIGRLMLSAICRLRPSPGLYGQTPPRSLSMCPSSRHSGWCENE